MSEEWENLERVLWANLEAQFRRYEERLDGEVFEWANAGPSVVEQPWRPPADWREHVGEEPAREHVYVAPLAGDVMERDEHGAWRTVGTGGFGKVRFTRLEGEAAKLFKIPYAGS